jgi:hypothetical protein
MSNEGFKSAVSSLLDEWNRREIDIDHLAHKFETAAWNFHFRNGDLPRSLRSLVNKVELIRFTALKENQHVAITNTLVSALNLTEAELDDHAN